MLLIRSVALAALLVQGAIAHVTLRYPPAEIRNDFLDNIRTVGLCGHSATGSDGSSLWQQTPIDKDTKTVVKQNAPLDVDWDLHYAHQGGWKMELYSANETFLYKWDSPVHQGCEVDGTIQNAVVTMPDFECKDCILRFQRQAMDWGESYMFHSCALIDIVADGADDCNGCNGHGTCQAGACVCDSSMDLGFWYGDHCQNENECEADDNCGSNGKCVDLKADTAPAKQCFCESGFWGDENPTPSKMTRRSCDRASSLTLGTPAEWANEYEKSQKSPGGTFEMYYKIDGDELEVAMSGETTSWLAFGFRAMSQGNDASAAQPAASGAAEPAASAAAEPAATAAEPAARSAAAERAGTKATASEPAATKPATGEPAAKPATGEPAAKPTTGEPAAASEPRRRLQQAAAAEPATTATAAEPAAASEGAAVATCPTLAPGAKETNNTDVGSVPNQVEIDASTLVSELPPAAGADAVAAAAEPASGRRLHSYIMPELENPAAANARVVRAFLDAEPSILSTTPQVPSISRTLSSMPSLEASAHPSHRITLPNRKLLQAAAEPATTAAEPAAEPAAEGEPATGASTEAKMFGEGTCTNVLNGVSPTPHAMINQDVVMSSAVIDNGVDYIRVQDMFTPSRAKPQPDAVFGGRDDIVDAVGQETSDGKTLVKFRRKLSTGDALFTDYCIEEGVRYQAIWAYGQLTSNKVHVPDSSLEIIPDPTNADFYKADELKFHGGGISVGVYDGRGTLGTFDFFAEPSDGACVASSLTGYDCGTPILGGAYTLHHKIPTAGDATVQFAAQATGTGYIAAAFPTTSGTMVGSTAVIGWLDAAGVGNVAVYDLNARSAAGVVARAGAGRRLQQAGGPDISNMAIAQVGGQTTLTFERAIDAGFDGVAPVDMLAAYSPTDASIVSHGASNRQGFSLSVTGDGSSVGGVEDIQKYVKAHAWLMVLGWGALIPIGVILARTMKDKKPYWFYAHIACNTLGLLLATAGFIIALVKFETDDSHRHRQLGIAVMVLGWLQPLNAVIRPHPTTSESTSTQVMLRSLWQHFHWIVGRAAIVCAFWNIFWGIQAYDSLYEGHIRGNNIAFGTWIGALTLVWLNLQQRSDELKTSDLHKRVALMEQPNEATKVIIATGTKADLAKQAESASKAHLI